MEEMLKQIENGANLLSMFEPSMSNIIKEIGNLKLKCHLVDAARRNVEKSEPTQNQTKDNSPRHESQDDQVESKNAEKHYEFNDINQVTECLIKARQTNKKQRGYLIEQNALIKRLFEHNNHLISLLRDEQVEKLELMANMFKIDQERIRLIDELKALKQNSNSN